MRRRLIYGLMIQKVSLDCSFVACQILNNPLNIRLFNEAGEQA